MRLNDQWMERVALIAEYRACVEHYAALATLKRDSARREKPIELTEAARLNCEAARARLAEHKTGTRQLKHRNGYKRAFIALVG
jgi:hypothetical protein